MKARLVIGVIGAALFLGAGGRACADFYTITDLGTIGSGNTFYKPLGVNDSGQVVGYSWGSFNGTNPFLYSGGQMVNPGLPQDSVLYGINSSGQIVGTVGEESYHAFLYRGGKLTNLGSLGGGYSFASGINDSGQVVGGTLTKTSQVPYVFSNGKMTALGVPGSTSGYAVAINSSGQIVGTTQISGYTSPATFLYSAGQTTILPLTQVAAINKQGQIVGSLNNQPYFYSNGTGYTLGTLPGYTYGGATGINDSGHVVGNLAQAPFYGSPSQPFLWKGGPVIPLQSLLPPDSQWKLVEATAINNLGQIAGWGYNPQGVESAFLMTPPVDAPEPSSCVLLGMGAASLAGYAWRKRKRLRDCAPSTSGVPTLDRAP